RPPGARATSEAGLRLGLDVDTRDQPAFPRRGMAGSLHATGMATTGPGAAGSYLRTHAFLSGYHTLPGPVPMTVAARARTMYVAGDPPVFAAARLGGRDDLRGFSEDRFTGDAAANGTLSLRLPLFPANLVARGTVGISAFADAGRVWVDGDSHGGWHTATGAGLWFTTPPATVAVEWARGEKDAFYLRLGLGL
ncbi:MAG: BamA/TamA family outer membrane protein, partial [Gemmatimonadota bacterium]